MRTISADQLPAWFQLSRYRVTNTMDLGEWYENLGWRSIYLTLFRHELQRHRAEIEGYFHETEGRKLVWTAESGARRDSSPRLRAKTPKELLITTTVGSMLVDSVARFIASARDDNSGLGRQLSEAASYVQAERNTFIDIKSGDAAPDFLDQAIASRKRRQEAAAAAGLNEPFDLLERKDKPLTKDEIVHVEVDLFASNKLILADFKNWLKAARSVFDIPAQSNYSRTDRANWVINRVLPYLDLTLWAALENVKIRLATMGNALFPDDKDSDLAEKIRRTVGPTAEKLIRPSVMYAIAVQVENRREKHSK